MTFKKGNISWNEGIPMSEETKRKQSEAHRDKHHSEDTRRKIGKSNSREKSYRWKGGIKHNSNGYLLFKLPEGCKFSCMRDKKGYIPLHRLIMAEYLQRLLKDKEVIHHINGDKTDNRIENLKLFANNGKHVRLHYVLKREVRCCF